MSRELLSAIEQHESDALRSGDLQAERIEALNYYLGKPFGNEVEGRSQIVLRDVQDTIEWIKPSLMRIFCAGDEIVTFTPTGQEDVEAAAQESDFINYVVTQKNNWFRIAYVWFTDALLQKNGYVKAWYDERIDVTPENYTGLTDDELALIAQDPEVEIVEHSTYPDPQAQPMSMLMAVGSDMQPQQVPLLHTVKLHRKKIYGCVKVKELPPERVLVSNRLQSVDITEECEFVEHFEYKTLSELRREGFDIPDDISGSDSNYGLEFSEENARDLYNENTFFEDDLADPASRRVKVREVWIKFDENDDGIAELRHVIVVGRTELLNEECEFIPVAALTPTMMPHRHIGQSIADAVTDLQLIRSTLVRGFLDNLYLANNGRYGIDENLVNLDDMLTSRPGGVVRTKGSPAASIMPLVHTMNAAPVLQGLEYLDSVRENRTGVTRYNQGLDANSLNKTASGITQIMNAAQGRIELIARVFAETGVKQLFVIMHALTLKHARKPEIFRLRNKWIPVDPRQWKKRVDMIVSVGLGTGNKDQQLGHLQAIAMAQAQAIQMGGLDQIVTMKNVYNVQAKIAQNAGFKTPEEFWQDPEQVPPPAPTPPDPKIELEKQKLELEKQKVMADIQLQREKMMADIELEKIKLEADIQLQREKAQTDAQIKLETQSMAAAENQAQNDEMKTNMQKLFKGLSNIHRVVLPNVDPESMVTPEDEKVTKEKEEDKAKVDQLLWSTQQLVQAVQALQQNDIVLNNKLDVIKIERMRGKDGKLAGIRRHFANGDFADVPVN